MKNFQHLRLKYADEEVEREVLKWYLNADATVSLVLLGPDLEDHEVIVIYEANFYHVGTFNGETFVRASKGRKGTTLVIKFDDDTDFEWVDPRWENKEIEVKGISSVETKERCEIRYVFKDVSPSFL